MIRREKLESKNDTTLTIQSDFPLSLSAQLLLYRFAVYAAAVSK